MLHFLFKSLQLTTDAITWQEIVAARKFSFLWYFGLINNAHLVLIIIWSNFQSLLRKLYYHFLNFKAIKSWWVKGDKKNLDIYWQNACTCKVLVCNFCSQKQGKDLEQYSTNKKKKFGVYITSMEWTREVGLWHLRYRTIWNLCSQFFWFLSLSHWKEGKREVVGLAVGLGICSYSQSALCQMWFINKKKPMWSSSSSLLSVIPNLWPMSIESLR